MRIATSGRQPAGDNFPSLVDAVCLIQRGARVFRNQRVEIDHGPTVLPQERAGTWPKTDRFRSSHDLTPGIAHKSVVAGIGPKRSEIRHYTALPKKSVVNATQADAARRAAGQIRIAHNIPGLRQPHNNSLVSSQGPQVL